MINLRPLTFLVLGIASVFRVALAMTHQVTAGRRAAFQRRGTRRTTHPRGTGRRFSAIPMGLL